MSALILMQFHRTCDIHLKRQRESGDGRLDENKVLETIVNDGNRFIVLRFLVEIKEWSNSLSSLLQILFLLTLPTTSTFENIFH